MILQNENGLFRLSQELAQLDAEKLESWVDIDRQSLVFVLIAPV